MYCVMQKERLLQAGGQRAVDQSQAGFYVCNSPKGTFMVLALPRTEKGARERYHNGKRQMCANYMKIIRPGTGFAPHDMEFKVISSERSGPLTDTEDRGA
jgi:hypothetical protein